MYRLTKKQGLAKDYGLKRQILITQRIQRCLQAGQTKTAAVRGFINYLKEYEEHKAANLEP